VTAWLLAHKSSHRYPAELQFIAIDYQYQRQGLGKKLLKEISKDFKNKKINRYKVGTWAKNPDSNAFYQKSGFTFLNKQKVLGRDFNFYLSPKLK